jgi:hypothetical protein
MSGALSDPTDPTPWEMVRCTVYDELVPAMRFCTLCGEQFGPLDLTKIFTASERAAGYAEVEPAEPNPADIAVIPEPAVEAAREDGPLADGEAPARRGALTALRAWLPKREAPQDDVRPEGEDTTTASLPTVLGGAEPAETDSDDDVTADVQVRRRRLLVVGLAAAGVAALCVASGIVITARPDQPPNASATSRAVATLPGWARSAAWSTGQAEGRVAVTADGALVGSAHASTVTITDADTGRTVTTSTLAGAVRGGVFPVTVSGKPALLASTASTVTVWTGKHAAASTTPLQRGTRLQIRAGVPFLVTGRTVAMLTEDGARPVTSPRPGAAVLGAISDGAVLWASARGEVITAAVNGTVVGTATLERPDGAAKITRWVTATPDAVWVRWAGKGDTVLASHVAATGKIVASVPADPTGAAAASQSGDHVLVDGVLFTAAGKRVPLPDGFVAGEFLGDTPYGASTDGKTALFTGGRTRTVPAPAIVPVAITANRGLVALTDGHVSMYPTRTT